MSKPISLLEARLAAGLGHADHAAGGAGQDRVLALEQLGGGEAARRHHEHQARAGFLGVELGVHRRDIAAQDRREIGIHHGGVAAADQLDQRRDLVADRHLREIHVARELGDALLVLRIAVGVHEHDRDRLDAVGLGALKLGAHAVQIELALDRAVGAHALVDLDTRSNSISGLMMCLAKIFGRAW